MEIAFEDKIKIEVLDDDTDAGTVLELANHICALLAGFSGQDGMRALALVLAVGFDRFYNNGKARAEAFDHLRTYVLSGGTEGVF